MLFFDHAELAAASTMLRPFFDIFVSVLFVLSRCNDTSPAQSRQTTPAAPCTGGAVSTTTAHCVCRVPGGEVATGTNTKPMNYVMDGGQAGAGTRAIMAYKSPWLV